MRANAQGSGVHAGQRANILRSHRRWYILEALQANTQMYCDLTGGGTSWRPCRPTRNYIYATADATPNAEFFAYLDYV